MSVDDVIKIGESKMNLARNCYIITAVIVIIIAILIIMLIKARRKGLINNLKLILPIVCCFIFSLLFFIEGFNAHIIANRIKKDSIDMNSYSLSGVIDDIYAEAKTLFIVIDSESYICREVDLNTDASVGKGYNIEYLENSKLIIEMEEID